MDRHFKERLMAIVGEAEDTIEDGLREGSITREEYNALYDARADLYITLDCELKDEESAYM